MQAGNESSRFATVFKNAEATRQRLIDLGRSAELDFPCAIRLVDPTAAGAVAGGNTTRFEKLRFWIQLIEEGYVQSLAKAAATERGAVNPADDRLPNLDAYLRTYDEDDGELLNFAGRLLALSDEDRCACTIAIYGAPNDSELAEFAPGRRAYAHGIGVAIPNVGDCDSHAHASVILMALQALGPTATVRNELSIDSLRSKFQTCRSLATGTWMPWLWTGTGTPHATLAVLYVNECSRVVRAEYDWWATKAPALLAEDNPILRWLATPCEPNRLTALNFALRHAREYSDHRTPSQSADTAKGGRPGISKAEAHKREQLVERWIRAKDAHIRQKDFCVNERVTLKYLTKCINWLAQKRRRKDES